jgi:hypothetical protein
VALLEVHALTLNRLGEGSRCANCELIERPTRRARNKRDIVFVNKKERLLMTMVLTAFVGGFAVGVLGAVAFTVYLGAKVAQGATNPLPATADWSGATVWEVVASDEVDCSQLAHRLNLRSEETIHALGLRGSPGAAIVPALDVTTPATHFHQPVTESQSPGVDDVVLANERRRGNAHALALAVSTPVDTPVGATEPGSSLRQPASANTATCVTAHDGRSRRQTRGRQHCGGDRD